MKIQSWILACINFLANFSRPITEERDKYTTRDRGFLTVLLVLTTFHLVAIFIEPLRQAWSHPIAVVCNTPCLGIRCTAGKGARIDKTGNRWKSIGTSSVYR